MLALGHYLGRLLGRSREAVGPRAKVRLPSLRAARRRTPRTLRGRPGSIAPVPQAVKHRPADWSQAFDDPIPLPGREPLTTLRQAGEYIAALSAKDQRQTHWQTAAEVLLMAAEGRGPLMFAHIGMLRALNHGKPATPLPERRKPARKYRIVR